MENSSQTKKYLMKKILSDIDSKIENIIYQKPKFFKKQLPTWISVDIFFESFGREDIETAGEIGRAHV